MNSLTFRAPWGRMLRGMSVFSVVLILGIFIAIWVLDKSPASRSALLLLPALLIGTALFVIRSYTIEPTELLIRRLLWNTRLPLAGLKSAVFQPKAMHGSLRLCGNGGMFSFTGWYRNRALGFYHAFVTDLNHTVVLRIGEKTYVISPENPERFVAEISTFAGR